MATSFDAIRNLVRTLADQLEDLWIVREAYRQMLLPHSSAEELRQIEEDAKANPQNRAAAQQAFAAMRQALQDAALQAAIEALEDTPPPSGEPN